MFSYSSIRASRQAVEKNERGSAKADKLIRPFDVHISKYSPMTE